MEDSRWKKLKRLWKTTIFEKFWEIGRLKQNLNIHRKELIQNEIPLDSLNDSQPIYESIDELEEKQQVILLLSTSVEQFNLSTSFKWYSQLFSA